MGKNRETVKNPNIPAFFCLKNRKKTLDKGGRVWYSIQARSREIVKRAKRTLKTIQMRETRNKEEDSEDSKELNIERCKD